MARCRVRQLLEIMVGKFIHKMLSPRTSSLATLESLGKQAQVRLSAGTPGLRVLLHSEPRHLATPSGLREVSAMATCLGASLRLLANPDLPRLKVFLQGRSLGQDATNHIWRQELVHESHPPANPSSRAGRFASHRARFAAGGCAASTNGITMPHRESSCSASLSAVASRSSSP